MAVITISRQYGSGGDQIAARVCEILGYSMFDKNLMVQVASEVGLSESEVVDLSEESYKMQSFLDRLLGRRTVAKVKTWTQDSTGAETLTVQELAEDHGRELVRKTIVAAQERGNVLVLGRGGQAILREKPGVLHVRIAAPMGGRVLRIQEQEGLSREEARRLARQKDRSAAEYLERFFHIEWDNPMLYHLMLNTGRWDIEAAAQIIVNALSHLPRLSFS